jgi:hypothetical protein
MVLRTSMAPLKKGLMYLTSTLTPQTDIAVQGVVQLEAKFRPIEIRKKYPFEFIYPKNLRCKEGTIKNPICYLLALNRVL